MAIKKQNQDLTASSGDDYVIVIQVLDSDLSTPTQDVPVNITGCTAKFAIARANNKKVLVSKSTSDDIVIADGPNGVIEINMHAADTEDFDGDYQYECELTDTLGNRTTVAWGAYVIRDDLIE